MKNKQNLYIIIGGIIFLVIVFSGIFVAGIYLTGSNEGTVENSPERNTSNSNSSKETKSNITSDISSNSSSNSVSTSNNSDDQSTADSSKQKSDSCIITISGTKYDIAEFRQKHPGGNIFKCDTDMTSLFKSQHTSDYLKKLEKYKIS